MITTGLAHNPLPICDGADWRQLWRQAITESSELLALLGLGYLGKRLPPATDFSLRVPRGFVARMRHGNPRDPLLLQVLPQLAELNDAPGFITDAVGDLDSRKASGVLHKYQGRALLIASGSCAVHCRYCFRRHFPYRDAMAARAHWQEALTHVRQDSSIHELILSGGDPLSLSTRKLEMLGQGLSDIPHVTSLRIHSRLPVVLPERIDDALIHWFAALPLRKVVVIHANHANEFDTHVDWACQRLRQVGVTLFNQSVLLRGVNDTVHALEALSGRMFSAGVLPYYLHQLDRVKGSAHFEVSDERALALMGQLRDRLPGYLVPRLVREQPGALSKRPLQSV